MKITKKEAVARRAAWKKAVEEGRVLRLAGSRFISFPSVEARDAYLAKLEPGLAVRAEEAPGLVDLNGEESITVHPLATNHVKVLSPGRGFRGVKR